MKDVLDHFSPDENNSSPSDVMQQAILFEQKLNKLKADLVGWIRATTGYDCALEDLSFSGSNGDTQFTMKLKFLDNYGVYACYKLIDRADCARLTSSYLRGEVYACFTAEQLDTLFQKITNGEIGLARKKTSAKLRAVADLVPEQQ